MYWSRCILLELACWLVIGVLNYYIHSCFFLQQPAYGDVGMYALKVTGVGGCADFGGYNDCHSLFSLRINSSFPPFFHAVGYPPQVGIAMVTP